jgi:O-antigen ligase
MSSTGTTAAAYAAPPSTLELTLVVVCVTLITAASFDEAAPSLSRILRVLAYSSTLLVAVRRMGPILRSPSGALRAFSSAYGRTAIIALGFYFTGLMIGAFRGPHPLYSLQQTFSDALVFSFAFVCFGWINPTLDASIRGFLKILALSTSVLLLASAAIHLGNLLGAWMINPYYSYDEGTQRVMLLMNGPFNHANHLAYVLMTGALSAGTLAVNSRLRERWAWCGVAGVLALGVLATFGRGAILGTGVGLLALLAIERRRLALLIAVILAVAAVLVAAATVLDIPVFDFLPKTTLGHRGEVWAAGLHNALAQGPLGVGSGQFESLPGLGAHNFLLEQYGEGGILTLAGVLAWLTLPVIHLSKSRLEPRLAWCIVAMMAGLMVHGIFWEQFLNGLRFLTLVYVALWVALGTSAARSLQGTSPSA